MPKPIFVKHTKRLLSVARVRERILADNPNYGSDLTEAEWDRITERLEALARLIWQISCQRATEQPTAPAHSSSNAK